MPHLTHADPAEIGLEPGRLQYAFDLLEDWTSSDQPPVPGAGLIVGRHGRVIRPRLFGRQGPETDAPPIRSDGMFLLASISKPVTYMGALLLVERGLLGLADRVTMHIPEFAAHHKEDVQVHHLFTHTSGLPDMLPDNEELRRQQAPLSRFIEGAIRDTVPLFKPGHKVSYQSMGTLIVAELIQRITGIEVHEFLRREIFEPLGLNSTTLGARGTPRDRLIHVETPPYQQGAEFGWNQPYWQDLGAPWGGLFSTLEDFAVICQMILSGGQMAGTRILSENTVAQMSSNRLDDYPDLPESYRRTQPWGLGWRLNSPADEDRFGDLLGPEVFGHTGATGTMAWIDPERQAFCLIFSTALRSKAPWRLARVSNAVAASFLS